MALDKTKLKDNLLEWMNGKNDYTTIRLAMEAFIDAYTNYAMDAEDVSGDPPDVVDESGAITVLEQNQIGNTIQDASSIFEQAIIIYWTNGTFVIDTPPPGTIKPEVSANVTTPPVPGQLQSDLLAIFSDISINTTDEQRAQQLADAFDTATKTVIVTCTGTLAGGGTLSVSGAIV